MYRKTETRKCAICKTHNPHAYFGIQISNGVYICGDCAVDMHDVVEQFYYDHEQHCNCPCCSSESDE